MRLQTSQNRRLSQRAQIAIAVRKRVGNKIYLCQASDISTEGMFLAHVRDGQRLPGGSKCWVEFNLPGKPDVLIAARGVIVRQKAHARFLLTAIRFARIAPSHRRLISNYISGPHLAAAVPAFHPMLRS